MKIFGWEINRAEPDGSLPSFAPETKDDGAVVVATGGAYGVYVDLDGSIRTEAELVNKYRDMAQNAEIEQAIDEITNEVIVIDDEQDIVEIVLDDLPIPENIKSIIEEEFSKVLDLLEFNTHAYEIFRSFYIDGRIYYHAIIDEKAPQEGVQELRYIDPRKIRKIREVLKTPIPGQAVDGAINQTINEYYIYNDKGFSAGGMDKNVTSVPAQGIKIAKDAIVHLTSGLTDASGKLVLSDLHRAIKPLNQLKALEDSTIIYRISRAPERRIFYIDVGNLPKLKAEQYLREIMTKHRNRLVYDASSGEIRDDRKFTTMMEDYWFPRRGEGKGTEVVTLPSGQNLGELTDVMYFQMKLFRALFVPFSRLQSDATFQYDPATGITRDELRFSKFIDRKRLRFSSLFLKILEKQMVLKGIMTIEDWEELSKRIKFRFARDNYFAEAKERLVRLGRLEEMNAWMPYIGRYVSNIWARKNVLRQTDDDIENIDQEIMEEMEIPQYSAEMMLGGLDPLAGQMGPDRGPPAAHPAPVQSQSQNSPKKDNRPQNRRNQKWAQPGKKTQREGNGNTEK